MKKILWRFLDPRRVEEKKQRVMFGHERLLDTKDSANKVLHFTINSINSERLQGNKSARQMFKVHGSSQNFVRLNITDEEIWDRGTFWNRIKEFMCVKEEERGQKRPPGQKR